jgi:hypothetical protein
MIEVGWDASLEKDCVHRFEFARRNFLPRFRGLSPACFGHFCQCDASGRVSNSLLPGLLCRPGRRRYICGTRSIVSLRELFVDAAISAAPDRLCLCANSLYKLREDADYDLIVFYDCDLNCRHYLNPTVRNLKQVYKCASATGNSYDGRQLFC